MSLYFGYGELTMGFPDGWFCFHVCRRQRHIDVWIRGRRFTILKLRHYI